MRFDKLILSGKLLERVTGVLPERRPRPYVIDLDARSARIEQVKAIRAGLMDHNVNTLLPSVSRARTGIRRAIASNFLAYWDADKRPIPARFLTLTFQANITDLAAANGYWTRFVRAAEREFFQEVPRGLKYICVPEFQKRGAVHYHAVLFNFPFAPRVYDRFREVWRSVIHGLGTANLKTIGRGKEDAGKIGSYVAKYISKQASDHRFFGRKRYFVSRGLRSSLVSRQGDFNSRVAVEYGLSDRVRIVDAGFIGTLELADRVLSDVDQACILGEWPMPGEISTGRQESEQLQLL